MLWIPQGKQASLGFTKITYGNVKGNEVQFTVDDNDLLVKLWPLFKSNFKEVPHFALVARRFHFSLSRYDWEDELIDLIIALEALLLPENTENKGSKIAKRLSKLLWKRYNRDYVTRIGNEAYDLRNSVVHGDLNVSHGSEIRDMINSLSILVKEALQTYLLFYSRQSVHDFVKNIDLIKKS
jgi:hypothetical protein